MKKMFTLLAALLVAVPALAQNAPSGSPRVQGVPDGYGDPVQVTIVGANGADTTLTTTPSVTGNGTAATAQRVTIASDSTGQVIALGNVASGAADSGNPVKIGCVYRATQTTLTDGQRGDVGCSNRLSINTELMSGNSVIATANGLTVQPFGFSSTFWSYTSGTSPILSNTTTAVTIKTAAGAGVITYIDSCQFGSTALGASVPLALRDGAGGTVKFAVRPPTAGWLTPWTVNFQPPLKGTANTLWEIVTTTADTSGTFDVNCQGHTGS